MSVAWVSLGAAVGAVTGPVALALQYRSNRLSHPAARWAIDREGSGLLVRNTGARRAHDVEVTVDAPARLLARQEVRDIDAGSGLRFSVGVGFGAGGAMIHVTWRRRFRGRGRWSTPLPL